MTNTRSTRSSTHAPTTIEEARTPDPAPFLKKTCVCFPSRAVAIPQLLSACIEKHPVEQVLKINNTKKDIKSPMGLLGYLSNTYVGDEPVRADLLSGLPSQV